MTAERRRDFLIVATVPQRRVTAIFCSPSRPVKESEETDLALLKQWRTLEDQYQSPNYEVIMSRATNLRKLPQALPHLHGWRQAKRETTQYS